MAEYLSPGVYVEEVPSLIKPIATVSTSIAGFIGVVPDTLPKRIPQISRETKKIEVKDSVVGEGDGTKTQFDLPREHYRVETAQNTFNIRVDGNDIPGSLVNDEDTQTARVIINPPPVPGAVITVDYEYNEVEENTKYVPENDKDSNVIQVNNLEIDKKGDTITRDFELPAQHYPVIETEGTFKIWVNNVEKTEEATLVNDDNNRTAKVTITGDAPEGRAEITVTYQRFFKPVAIGEVKVCTNFTEFTKFFGTFSHDSGQNTLAHAVYGFFNNGGSRCYVVRVNEPNDIDSNFLERTFEPIDEIAIVAAPGIGDIEGTNADVGAIRAAIITHCEQRTQDRFAIFDCPEVVGTDELLNIRLLNRKEDGNVVPDYSDYAAFYFPWIEVFDPATKTRKYMPPSGHIAGIYARVDTAIGVHKAPANEVIFGALGLKYKISKAQQTLLNPQGVNCIRDLNGNYLVWGARTIGGDANSDLKYINVRRTLLFLRESIDEGTQWVVFEPNTPNLWKRITRNVSDFLTTVWRSGALFGDTPEQAFYVKCDAETNPPEERELGRVVTEIGVAIVRPAEFVIFRISQITALNQQ